MLAVCGGSFAINVVEIVARVSTVGLCVLSVGNLIHDRQLNTCTLDGIVTITHQISKVLNLHCGHMCLDRFSEICVCIMLVPADLCTPIWSQ